MITLEATGGKMDRTEQDAFLRYYNTARNPLTHKGDYGRVFIIAGSEGMTGAAMLCAESALRAGAGLVYLFAPGKLLPVYEIGCREAVKIKVGDDSDAYFTERHIRQIRETVTDGAVVLGPGLGRNPETVRFVHCLLAELSSAGVPVILDADGLYACGLQAEPLSRYDIPLIITPHAAELARLTGLELPYINQNRARAAEETARKTGAITVLKGSGTVIAAHFPGEAEEVRLRLNSTGNPGMATGGSGDVLAGILAGIIASDPSASANDRAHLYELVRCGVYIHGLCGDIAAEKYGERAVKAGDLTEMLKEVFHYGT